MEKRQDKINLFKYNAILSIIFFLGSTFYLTNKIPNFNLSVLTISEMSYYLNPSQLSFFNLLFFIKAFMDLSFFYYVYKYFHLKFFSLTSISWIIAVLAFGLLGFFPTHQNHDIHLFLVYIVFFFATLSEILFARLTKNEDFKFLTNNLIIVQLALIILFFITSGFNGIFEIIYMLFVFLWLMVFIGRYLK